MTGRISALLQVFRKDTPKNLPGFDRAYYIEQNPDVRAAGVDPLRHYMDHGWKERRDPSRGFSTAAYLDANPDVRERELNPLVHYLHHGIAEGRALHPETISGPSSAVPPRNGASADERVAVFHRATAQRGKIV